jgi:zona occludens toxin
VALYLTTGVPGAGKTLYTVAKALPELTAVPFEYRGATLPRRLVVGGIPGLLLEHELMDVPVFDPETFKDEYSALKRDPGDDPLPVPCRGDNWWLWCLPGDIIVIDECQRLFRPMASGRKIPQFIAKLETHRHYGVDFVFITQHPQLLHTNVRNLIGRHQHVRRVSVGRSTIVYEWDHCTHPDKVKTASVKYWPHDKKAFGLYKSAEVHTKPVAAKPTALYVLVAALLGVGLLGWRFYSTRLTVPGPGDPAATGGPGAVPPAASSPGSVGALPAPGAGKVAAQNALFIAFNPPPPAPSELPELPDHVAGCYLDGSRCHCVTTRPASIADGYERFCRAVMAGRFAIPARRVPSPPAGASSAPLLASAPASAPVVEGLQ